LKTSGVNHEFRTTLVKELHEEEDVEKMAKLLSPDSKYFLQKFVDSGEILSDGLSPLSDEISQKYLKTAQALVPFAQLRGI
jgi:pyruvate formate lyase activating enzyme